jgi:alkylated DNA repair dioxygenase AlkB
VTDQPSDLFGTPLVPGFVYKPDLVPAGDQVRLAARFEKLPFKPFDFHGYLGNRRIVSFGWSYDYGARSLLQAEPMPDFLMPLREMAGALSGLQAEIFEQALVTEYAPGAGIGWHRDKPMFHHIVALSFLSPCRLRFRRRAANGWERRNIIVAPRSGYMLDGEARMVWEHSIPPVEHKRYSVTFRDFISESAPFRTKTGRAHGG